MFTIPFDLFGFVDAIRSNSGVLIITAIFGPLVAIFCLAPFARIPGISQVIQTLSVSLLTSIFVNLLCVIVIYLAFTKDIIRLFWSLIVVQIACLSFWFSNKKAVLKLAEQYSAIRQRHPAIEEETETEIGTEKKSKAKQRKKKRKK
ncbi:MULTISPECIES: hypothetical protein [Photorhabdus]|uniref:Uncharacterized protein n=1 Tax=Photorhabdus asymbiotica TaxID=291112 RepID=A0ABX9SGQ7_9GAMM|nr:hypothetical protein [Photorhabdus asymbiotica]RKS54070.1 hypothetical protein BDD30_4431 [Photorhabdus asymbiotica]